MMIVMKSFAARLFCFGLFTLVFLAVFLHTGPHSAHADQNIVITASVGANPDQMIASLSSADSGTVSQNQNLLYTITYGTKLAYSTPLTIQATWGEGTIDGATQPSVTMVDYVSDSAGKAYGNTPAIVDVVNHTITWSITSFPANRTGDTVSFSLETQANYTGTKTVSFPVTAHILDPAVSTDSTVTKTYLYTQPTATPTPTPTPTTSTTSTTTTATATPLLPGTPLITSISLIQVSSTAVTVQIEIAQPIPVRLQFGPTPKNLTQSVVALDKTDIHDITLDILQPGTQYYFTVSSDDAKFPFLSDIYTFTTPTGSTGNLSADASTLVVTQDSSVVYDAKNTALEHPNAPIVVATGSILDLNITIPQSGQITTATIFIRSSKVLGISTVDLSNADLQTDMSSMIEIGQSLYIAKVKTPNEPGNYDVVIRLEDVLGNISEQQIATMQVLTPFSIASSTSGHVPIADARVLLMRYDPRTALYTVIPNTSTSIHNPVISDGNGIVNVNLYAGTYAADISATGYISQHIIFTLDPEGNSGLPHVMLVPAPISPTRMAQNAIQLITEIVTLFSQDVQSLAHDSAVFDLIFTVSLILLVILSWILVALRLRIPAILTPVFIMEHVVRLVRPHTESHTVHGTILDEETAFPIPHVKVQIADASTKKVIQNTNSNALGEFHFYLLPYRESYELRVQKSGFSPVKERNIIQSHELKNETVFMVKGHETILELIGGLVRQFFGHAASFSCELFLILTLSLEYLFAQSFGILRAFPFLTITISCILVVILDNIARSRIHKWQALQSAALERK
jgi:hypothetical protein